MNGQMTQDFLNRTGAFAGKQTVGNIPKLVKSISIARKLTDHYAENPVSEAISFVTGGIPTESVWEIHERLISIGYHADLTALHCMMDLGFQVIKPDLVVSRLFLDWGWLHFAIPSLPQDISREDLIGKGRYGNKYHYTKPLIYKPIINLAKQIASATDKKQLENDIGWVTDNPLRELDIFIVKAGQISEPGFGIACRLYP
jgi:hypothetical protein